MSLQCWYLPQEYELPPEYLVAHSLRAQQHGQWWWNKGCSTLIQQLSGAWHLARSTDSAVNLIDTKIDAGRDEKQWILHNGIMALFHFSVHN
jgi:hypothetical protein